MVAEYVFASVEGTLVDVLTAIKPRVSLQDHGIRIIESLHMGTHRTVALSLVVGNPEGGRSGFSAGGRGDRVVVGVGEGVVQAAVFLAFIDVNAFFARGRTGPSGFHLAQC